MALKALLFDVDGTLADTESRGHLPAYNKAFRELGLDWRWTPKLYRDLLHESGASGRARIRHYLTHYNPPLGAHARAAAKHPEELVESVHTTKSRHFGHLLQRGEMPLRTGVARLMREAHAQGVKIGLVTNASPATMQAFMDHGLGEKFRCMVDVVVEGTPEAAKKPAPDLYLKALDRLSVYAGECVAIEDSMAGLEAAVQAGIATLVTVNEYTHGKPLGKADLVLSCLGEAGEPFTVLHGDAGGAHCVTLDLLRGLLRRHVRETLESTVGTD